MKHKKNIYTTATCSHPWDSLGEASSIRWWWFCFGLCLGSLMFRTTSSTNSPQGKVWISSAHQVRGIRANEITNLRYRIFKKGGRGGAAEGYWEIPLIRNQIWGLWWDFATQLLLLISDTWLLFSVLSKDPKAPLVLSLAAGSNATLNLIAYWRQENSCFSWHPNRLDYVTTCHSARAGTQGATVKTTGSRATETITLPHTSWFLVAVTSTPQFFHL